MLETASDGTGPLSHVVGNIGYFIETCAFIGKSACDLVDENSSGETSSTGKRALLAGHCDIIADNRHSDGVVGVGDCCSLLGETLHTTTELVKQVLTVQEPMTYEEKDISGISHNDDTV